MDYRFDYTLFKKSIREAREGRGLTQTQIGEIIGKTRATISRYESATVMPEIVDFLALCYYFDFNPLDFLKITLDAKKTAYMFDELLQMKKRSESEVNPLS